MGDEAQRQAEAELDAAASKKRPRGFATLSPERRREISSKGGIVSHQMGRAHEFTQEEAREAGRKGGKATHANRRAAKAAP